MDTVTIARLIGHTTRVMEGSKKKAAKISMADQQSEVTVEPLSEARAWRKRAAALARVLAIREAKIVALRYQSHAAMAQAVSALRRAREGSGASLDRRARQQLTARCFRTWLELERRGELRAEGGAQTAEQLTPLADEQLASHADSGGRLSAARPS
ncbi:hypothetical protein T492DRAFT_256069 [Pavlovales sp. CCMP2436]|nr:hypothetical protein T492DRAFT_256069 [Pavlovales sp. CCMP2436]